MTLQKNQPILESLEPEIAERLVSRREAVTRGAGLGAAAWGALALGSVPVMLAGMARNAFAQAPSNVADILRFAYLLENLEYYFYDQALNGAAFSGARAGLTPAQTTALTAIRRHELAHVNFLRTTLQSLGVTPATYTAASFDFTGGNGSGTGPFASATISAPVLLAAAQGFEDTGVRAYKGQAAGLKSNKVALTAALQIHSVEARHAAQLRRMRGEKGWITGNTTTVAAPAGPNQAAGNAVIARIYAGEENTNQASVDVASLAGSFGGTAAATESFDEPLTYAQVVEIVAPFVVGDTP